MTTINHKERSHALLSASSAERWMLCTPSARLEESFPDQGSEFAAEGTLAHEMAELKAKKHFIGGIGPRKFSAEMKKLRDHELYDPEMDRHTDSYLDYLKECYLAYAAPPYLALEKKVDYSLYAQEGFGTCDCIMIYGPEMRIIDLKYGKGVPKKACENPQLMMYALGAYEAYKLLYPIETVRMMIFQPRIDNIDEWSISIQDLLSWGESEVKPRARLAYDGAGEFKTGKHCQFCKAKAQCRAMADDIVSVFEPLQKEAPLLTDEEIGTVLAKAEILVTWAKAVKEYALLAVLDGRIIPGWKAVEGRSTRIFTDAEAAFAAIIASGVSEDMLYERKPLTLAQTEKAIGKKAFEEVAGEFVAKSSGAPTLVPESDKRPSLVKEVFQVLEAKENDHE